MSRTGAGRLTTSLLVAALASVGAGLVHAAAAGTHSDDPQLAWMFALCASAQIGWAAAAVAWPRRSVVAAGLALNAGCVTVWGLTRTVGLFGSLAEVEAVGAQDLIAAVLGGVAAVGAAVVLVGRHRHAGDVDTADSHGAPRLDAPLVAVAATLVLVLAVPAMAATHSHGSHSHTDAEADHHEDGVGRGGVEVAAAGAHEHPDGADTEGHAHTEGAGAGADAGTAAAGPVVSLDDARLTPAQRARATSLLERTRATLASFPDEASIVAAGYTWIGDGRRPGGFQHFVNRSYLGDGRMLDPGHIESFVLRLQPDGTKTVESAMYIAEPGTTMETVPDVGGELTVWHDHQNLCWDGDKLAGVVVNGVCRPGGTFRGTQPMIHVWAKDPPCGPFTGIEGHGGENCSHAH